MKNPKQLPEHRYAQMRQYNQDNAERLRAYQLNYNNERSKTDPVFKRKMNLGNKLRAAIRYGGYSERSCLYNIIGIPYEDLKIYLENTFYGNMNWEDRASFQIDHIIALSTATTVEEIDNLFFWKNMRGLTPADNRKKRNYQI